MAEKSIRTGAEHPPGQPLGRRFGMLLGAVGLGNLGDGIAVVALPWYAATLTDDPFQVALVGAATRLPWLLLALIAGVVGDRVDHRRLMVAAAGVKTVLLVGLTTAVALGAGSIPLLVGVALLVGACEVFFDNTAQAMVPTLVPRQRLERANGHLQGVERVLNKFLGAPIAGMLLAASTAWAFGAQAALILSALVCLLGLSGDHHPATDGRRRPGIRVMLGEGLSWLWHHPVLRLTALVSGASNLAAAMMAAVLVLFAQEVLGVGPQGYGWLMTVTAVGAVLGALVVPSFSHRVHPATALVVVLVILGTTAVTVGLTRNVPMFVLCYLFTGFAATWWNITLISLFQRLTHDRLRSRAFSAHRTLSWGMLSVGMALGGTLASALEGTLGREWALAVPYLVAGTIGLILAVVVTLRLTRRVIDQALDEVEPA